jgi:hypothetical protein
MNTNMLGAAKANYPSIINNKKRSHQQRPVTMGAYPPHGGLAGYESIQSQSMSLGFEALTKNQSYISHAHNGLLTTTLGRSTQ